MANTWQITAREADLLFYLPHAAQILYLTVFRRHMCFTTGTVGNNYRLSEQALAERLEVHRPRGSTAPEYKPTRQAIRTAIAQLIRAGLLIKIKGRQFTFKLPAAITKPRRTHNPEPVRPVEEQPEEQPIHAQHSHNPQAKQTTEKPTNSENINGLATELPTKTPPLEQPEEQPTTGKPLNTTRAADTPFQMFEDWRPSKRFDDLLERAGMFYTDGLLMKFKLFWLKPGYCERSLDQAEWEFRFYEQIDYARRTKARKSKPLSVSYPPQTPNTAPYSAGHKPFNREARPNARKAEKDHSAGISALNEIKRTLFGRNRQTCYKSTKTKQFSGGGRG